MEKVREEMRKGPWTEQEDMQLVCYARLFAERRWDFIARISGLNRNGKSCRLRWVNYLHPGLKRGRMTPQEERLVLELHARWGNRWSRIARKLPGRTDNEIKNYWRTLKRKKAQEMKRNASPSSSSTSGSQMSSFCEPQLEVNAERQELNASGSSSLTPTDFGDNNDEVMKSYSMNQIWNEIISSEYNDEARNIPWPPFSASTSDTLWRIHAEEPKNFHHTGVGFLISNYHFGGDPYG